VTNGSNNYLFIYGQLVISDTISADDCQLITTTGHWWLRMSNVATCDVSRTCTSLGDWSFTAAVPRLWNNLSLHIRDFELSPLEFRWLPKTPLFDRISRRLVTYFRCSSLYKCTDLLTYYYTLMKLIRQYLASAVGSTSCCNLSTSTRSWFQCSSMPHTSFSFSSSELNWNTFHYH